ncbi:MAG: PHP domain-containing protein [Clostridiales bacterium]|nr:PHP domain-containing protein [Candidatus Apopatocola equi]
MMKVDLHTHSVYSGGSDTPAELMRKAKDAGLSAVALTDYCSLEGLEEAAAAAAELGLEFVPGVELPGRLSRYETELRLLGFFFDPDYAPLRALIESAKTETPTVGQTASLIREAGGLVAMADPRACGISGMALDGFMQNVRCCGVEFVEVLYPGYSSEESQAWLDTAKEWSMDPIGGSGCGLRGSSAVIGEPEVDYEVYAWLRECKAQL